MGVQLFFVLSGFLITQSLNSINDYSISQFGKFQIFIRRRSLKIFPIYLLYVGIVAFTAFVFGFIPLSPKLLLGFVTFSFNYMRDGSFFVQSNYHTHLWTLSAEIQFYLLWALVYLFSNKKYNNYILIFTVILTPFIRFFYGNYLEGIVSDPYKTGDIIYWSGFCQADSFALGALLFLNRASFSFLYKMFIPATLIFLCAGIIQHFYKDQDVSFFSDLGYKIDCMANFQHIWSYTIINLFCASLIVFSISEKINKLFWSILENRFINWVGKISYSMYIIHWGLLTILRNYFSNMNLYVFFIMFLTITVIISSAIYVFYERHFLNFKMNRNEIIN